MIIPDTVLQTILSREVAVLASLQPYALHQDERDLITLRFGYLRALYQTTPPYTIQGLNALVGRSSPKA